MGIKIVKSGDQSKINIQFEIKQGKAALRRVIRNKADVYNAFLRPNLGLISLIYGKPGNPSNEFKTGYGISHIIAKRNFEAHQSKSRNRQELGITVANKLIEVVVKGKITKTVESKKTVHISYKQYEAIISLDFHGNSVNWIITGYKIKKGL